MGKAAIKWTDKLCLWESSLFLGYFYPCLSSAGGDRGKLALFLLLLPTPFACCFAKPPSAGGRRGQKRVCSVPEEQSSTWSRQRLCSAEMHSGTELLSAQRDPPHHRSSPSGCTRCLLPAALPGHRPHCDQPLCFEVRPQLLHRITSAYCTSGLRHRSAETLGFRQGRSPCLWTHFQGHLPLQAKPGTLLLPSAAVLCCGEMH